MALYIKDPEVDALATELQALKKGSKTAAVKEALKEAIEREQKQPPIRERLAKTFALMEELGPLPHRDHKKDMDELWGEED